MGYLIAGVVIMLFVFGIMTGVMVKDMGVKQTVSAWCWTLAMTTAIALASFLISKGLTS